jgi:hypothetical protein
MSELRGVTSELRTRTFVRIRLEADSRIAGGLRFRRSRGASANCSDSHHMKGVGTVIWFHIERSNGRRVLAGL